MSVPLSHLRVRFGVYEVDLRSGELHKRGRRIRLQEKPFQLLAALLERPGELVTRDQLREKLWPADTFVDFDGSLNAAANRLRDALDDSAANPRFVETLPRRGYRFVALVEPCENPPVPAAAESTQTKFVAQGRRPRGVLIVLAVAATILGVAAVAHQLLNDGTNSRPAPAEGRIMLGVLPLDEYSGDAEGGAFAQALTDELITELGRRAPARLGVIAATSMRAASKEKRPIEQIGRELAVDYLVEGGVRRSSDGIRITIRLVDVRSETPVWMDDDQEALTEFLDVEREAARIISRSLALNLLNEGQRGRAAQSAANPAAYESYLKGRYFREQMTEDGFRKGLEYFGRAISQDPVYARAYAGLAGCYCLLGGHGMEREPPHEVLPRAEQAALHALELDDSLPEAHAALGMIGLKYRWDPIEAKRRFERAIELNPSYAQAHLWFSLYYEVLGIADEAINHASRARHLDPLSIPALVNLAQQYHRAGRYEEAITVLGEALELDPDAWAAHWTLGDCYERTGRLAEAAKELAAAVRLSGNNPAALGSLGYLYGRAGQVELARGVLNTLEDLGGARYVSPVNAALVLLSLSEDEEALARLELGYEQRSRSMVWLNVDARFDRLREDPRFQTLMRNIGFHSRPSP